MNTLTKAAVQGAACGLMIGAVLLTGGRVWHPATVAAQAKQPAVADVVTARRYELVDAGGKLRATTAVAPDGSVGLIFFDAALKGRAFLGIGANGLPSLELIDGEGNVRTSLSSLANGTSGIYLRNGAKLGAQLLMAPDGASYLALRDAAGSLRVTLGVGSGGLPGLLLSDAAGNTRAAMGSISLEASETGEKTIRPESSLLLFDRDGKTIWQSP